MKTLINTVVLCLFCIQLFAQAKHIETHSATIDDLISYIVENFKVNDSELRNISFLIQVNDDDIAIEDKIILKQAFKIIAERLNEESKLSLLTYSKFSGIALSTISPKKLKRILHTLDDLKGNISEFYKDGLQLAYTHTEQNYIEAAKNSVVIIRIKDKANNEKLDITKKKDTKNKKDVLLATAIGLLPELISLIKD